MDKPTFEDIVHNHGRFIRGKLLRLGVGPRDLDDLTQDVLHVVARRLADFDPARAPTPQDALRGWLSAICERQASGYRRARHRSAEVFRENAELDRVPGPDRGAEARSLAAERVSLVLSLVDRLEHGRRAVVVAYCLQEIAMPEVAILLGIPFNTAWNRLRLAVRDLRDGFARAAMASPEARPRPRARAASREA